MRLLTGYGDDVCLQRELILRSDGANHTTARTELETIIQHIYTLAAFFKLYFLLKKIQLPELL